MHFALRYTGCVLPGGNIEVRAPLSMTAEKINVWLDRYEHKYLPIIKQCRALNALLREHPLGYGGEVLFMGVWTPIEEAEDDNGGCIARYTGGSVVMKPGLSEAEIRYQIRDLFYAPAKSVFEEKLHHYSDFMDVRYKAWGISDARNRHGSCDSNKGERK